MRERISQWTVPVVAAVAVLAGAFCNSNVSREDSTGSLPVPVRYRLPECPDNWYALPVDSTTPPIPSTGLSLAGKITNVPEFHDCQKLLIDGGTAYGPLVAIFAAYDLESLPERLDSLWSANVAPEREINPPRGSRPLKRAQPLQGRISVAAALILNLGEYYPGLALRPGYSCLYLWRVPPQVTQWQAKIVWVNDNHQKCLDTIKPDTFPGNLKVYRDVAPDFARGQYPAVARWDWDSSTSQQYIGIKCGQGWCEVGEPTFKHQDPFLRVAVLPSKMAQVQRIKGWYDEQLLAEPGGGVYKPSTVKGTIIPDESVGLRTNMEDYSQAPNPWRRVAYIALSGASKYYKDKLNLDKTPAGATLDSLNTLWFCLGTRAFCGVPNIGMPDAPNADCDQISGGSPAPWWTRIDPAGGGGSKYTCAFRTNHSTEVSSIPATARWRWLLKDETVWKECVTGCCQVRRLGP